MTRTDILEELKEILSEILEVEKNEISDLVTEECTLVGGIDNDLGISSIDYIELLVSVEEKFNVVFDFELRLATIGDMIDVILKEKSEGTGNL
ncbi:MAG: acyl carrier protein [Eisenbergiella sp.]